MLECLAPCAECSGTTETCTSCLNAAHYLYDNDCHESCPNGSYLTVFNTCAGLDFSLFNIPFLACDSSCHTCFELSKTCTDCFPSVPYLVSGTCREDCDSGFYGSGNSCLG